MQDPTQSTETTKPRIDLYQSVTDTIIQQLESGTIPWHRPWTGTDKRLLEIPYNGFSQYRYRGINILLLWCTAISKQYQSAEWATFRQWKGKNESIRKDEKGSTVVFYDMIEKEVDGEITKVPFLKASVVFNRCQLQSYTPEAVVESTSTPGLVEKFDTIDTFIENTGAKVGHIGSSAHFVATDDIIYMLTVDKFIDVPTCTATEGYYSTLLLLGNLANYYLLTNQYDLAIAILKEHKNKKLDDDREFKEAVADDLKEFERLGIKLSDFNKVRSELNIR